MPACYEFRRHDLPAVRQGAVPRDHRNGRWPVTVRKPTGRLPAGRPNFACYQPPAVSRLAGTRPGAKKGVLDLWEQDIGVFPVDFAEQSDQWSYHLRVELTGDVPMAGRGTDGIAPVELGPTLSGPVSSKLLVRPHPDGISCVVTGDDGGALPEQVDPWRQSGQAAVTLLRTRNRSFTWEAIVGVAPRLRRPVWPACATAGDRPGSPGPGRHLHARGGPQ